MDFEWDPRKDAVNRRKHGVSFDEAATVFEDSRVAVFFDEGHSDSEERYIALGISAKGRLLVVSHMYRGDVIRIISARKATAGEARTYG
jgi:uncharacterized DUF497 family protein